MISKYPGFCCICGKRTVAGKDVYDPATRDTYHATCKQNVDTMDQSTGHEDAESLADRLGYRKEE